MSVKAEAEIERLKREKAALQLKIDEMQKITAQHSPSEESENPEQRISAARKAAEEIRLLMPAVALPQTQRHAKRNAQEAKLHTKNELTRHSL